MPVSRLTRRRLLAGLGFGAAAPLLVACGGGDDVLAGQAGNADGKNYIAGDGSVAEYAQAERSEPVEFSGALFDGTEVSAESLRGAPAVLNFWYAACAPCRIEAPHLVSLHGQFASEGVTFLGVNVRDTATTAQAFERTFEIPYPSMEDLSGDVLLALSDFVPPQAVPSTLVLDAEGRVSARVLGAVEEGTLRALLKTVVDEQGQ
ncbi:TlpA family protein disulfide reductase [Micrococcus lylae]|uniref:TlpA family protein disulfide reductase n=1 Tax=Micrococcus lylae TaxID=1273 RepID=UPI0021A84343|nr:TlpA disulfide reductase family protein [Micrococcus lylae]MCT2008461.1 TlpA family protein disulfide reductase [Micrococcus lylae]MCT2072370.1 TlpA family protein disulfide reductase [Micrococcus lylae]